MELLRLHPRSVDGVLDELLKDEEKALREEPN